MSARYRAACVNSFNYILLALTKYLRNYRARQVNQWFQRVTFRHGANLSKILTRNCREMTENRTGAMARWLEEALAKSRVPGSSARHLDRARRRSSLHPAEVAYADEF